MKIRIDIARLVLHDQSLTRRERARLGNDINRELTRLVGGGVTAHRRRPSAVATQIATAIAAQLPPQPPTVTGAPRRAP